MSISINQIPNEVLTHVFNFLENDEELTTCMQVCKNWQQNVISLVETQELKKTIKTKIEHLTAISSYLSNSKVEAYQKDIDDLLSSSTYSLSKIKEIRSKSETLRNKMFHLGTAHSFLGEEIPIDMVVDEFLSADFFERALEEVAKSPHDEWSNAYKPIIEYMIEKKFSFENIVEKFKLLSPSAQSLFIIKKIQALDVKLLHLLTISMSPSREKDDVLQSIFDRFLKEDQINFETINFCIDEMYSNGIKTNLLFRALFHITKKENIDRDLVTNIVNLFDQVQPSEEVKEAIAIVLRDNPK